MAYASATTIASGSSPNVAVPFGYLETSDVHVSVNGTQIADNTLTWLNASTIVLPSTPTSGQSVTVYRTTPATSLVAQLVDGAFYDDKDLNQALLQLLYVAQESYDAGQTSASELATIIDTVNNAMASASESATAAASSASSASASASSAQASAELAASYAGTSQAPATAEYLVGASNGSLTGAFVITASAFISWTLSAGQAVASLIDGSITFVKLAAAAIASQSDAQAGTSNSLLMTPLRTAQAISALQTSAVFSTGDLKPTHKAAAESGWVLWADGTIGDASSNATIRANADTSALFALYYALSDSACPLFTSTGASTTRAVQGTASAAFGAHCAVSLPKGAGRFVGVAGSGTGLTTRSVSDAVGAETLTQTTSQMPSHFHYLYGDPSSRVNTGSGTPIYDQATDQGYSQAQTSSAGSGNPMNIMNPGAYANWEIKL